MNYPTTPSANQHPTAQGLLKYIPLPNLPGNYQNFHYVTSANSNSDDLNIRLNHSVTERPRADAGRRPQCSAQHLAVRLPLPWVGYYSDQSVSQRGWQHFGPQLRHSGFVYAQHRKTDQHCPCGFQSHRTRTQNLYAFSNDITGALGIAGVSQIRSTGDCRIFLLQILPAFRIRLHC